MWFLYLFTGFAILIQLSFVLICLVAGLYYLSEFVEEYAMLTKKIIIYMIVVVIVCHVGLLIFENFPLMMIVCGILSQLTHLIIMKTFPYVAISSVPFVMAICLLTVNHYLAFQYFGEIYYTFPEVMGYFTVALWLVPFALVLSLSANDHVLPTTSNYHTIDPLLNNDDDVVTKYLSRKAKKLGLLTPVFEYVKEVFISSRTTKKSF